MRGGEEERIPGVEKILLLLSFGTCLGASLASTGRTIWILKISSRTCAWTLQPKLNPISYSLFGQNGFCYGLLALRASFPTWIIVESESLGAG